MSGWVAYITPHSREQFRQRIAPLPDGEINAIVEAGLREPYNVTPKERRDGWPAFTVRVRGPRYAFRAVVVPSHTPGQLPAVVTILQATGGRLRPGRLK